MKTLLLSLALLAASPLADAQNRTPAQTSAATTSSMPGLTLDPKTRARLSLALKAGHSVWFLDDRGDRVARAVLDTQGLAQVVPDGTGHFDAATHVTITGSCASLRYALMPRSSADAALMVRTGDRTATLASVLSPACSAITGSNQVSSNAQNTSAPSSSMTGIMHSSPITTAPGTGTAAPRTGSTGTTTPPGSAIPGGVAIDVATTSSLTTALKAGLGVTLLDAGGRVTARTVLNAQGQAQLVRTGAGTAVRVSVTDPRNKSTRSYPLVRATGSLLVSVPHPAASGTKTGAAVTLASVLNAGAAASTSPTAASPHTPAVQLDTGTALGLTTALKAGRTVVFLGAQEQVIAHAALDAQGRARVVTDGTARLGTAIRVTISDARNNAKQTYALVPNTSGRLLIMATAGKTGTATNANLSLASVLNAPLTAQARAGAAGTVAVVGSVSTASQDHGASNLDAVTGVRLAAALKAGRTVVFLGAQGQVVAHAALDAQSQARIITDGTAQLGAAVRVTIGDARNNASQSYALVPGSSTSGLLVVATAGKGNGPANVNVSLASVLNAPLVSQRPAITPGTPAVSVGATVQTPGQATSGNVSAATSSAAPSQSSPSGSVSAGASVQTPASSVGASANVSSPATPPASVSVGTTGTTPPSAPAVGVSVGISGGGLSSTPAPTPVSTPAPVTTPAPPPISTPVTLPVPVPLPGVGGGSGGIGIGVGVGVGGH